MSCNMAYNCPVDTAEDVFLSVVVPCFNEVDTIAESVAMVLKLGEQLKLELIIVDDCSTDGSSEIVSSIAAAHDNIVAVYHDRNRGKGAALRTGFKIAKGEYVAVHDADLEYDPFDLLRLLEPLKSGKADVAFGSRYLHQEQRRVLYFWHSLMNKALTFLSNIFTDLDLTDMETCYKVFRREVIQGIEIEEDRFGFEPEIVAKVAQKRVPVYELGVSYAPRTYSEGKKINWRDGVRAIYCIFHYNAHIAPVPLQFLIYFFIGAFSAVCNILLFAAISTGVDNIVFGAALANFMAAAVNYWLCVKILFKHRAHWNTWAEICIYLLVVMASGALDAGATLLLVNLGYSRIVSKSIACVITFVANFIGRRFFVFPEPTLERY